jgi:DNA-binding transcriptional LysR family regulator
MITPDLNLLRVFDLLFEERSVSRTAQRLGLTQSAISHALGRLRDTVGDPLFTRSAGGLQPTARAEELAPQLREILVWIRTALNPPVFDPLTSSRTFTIAVGSYVCRLVLPLVVEIARETAPGVSFEIHNLDQALLDELDQGTVDVALGSFSDVPARIGIGSLFHDTLIWVASNRHPLADKAPDAADLGAQPRLGIVADYPFRALRADGAGERINRRRIIGDTGDPVNGALNGHRVPARVYDGDTALAIVGRTDLVTVLPRRLAALREEELGLRLFDAPVPDADIEISLIWHRRFARDPGLQWLRDLFSTAADPLQTG